MEIAERIYQVQLPLPFALKIVNCYLLRDDDGWTVVDAGLNSSAGRAAWHAAFAALAINPHEIRRVVLTHFHPDHYGMAGWLQRQSGARVLMSPREAELARMVWGKPADAPDPMVPLFVDHGTPLALAEAISYEVDRLRAMTLPHPELELIRAGDALLMGGREFRPIHAPGHSDGQLIYYAAHERLALVGDHVLIKITPHIGFWPESEPDPLGRYLASLAELRSLDVDLALPGHGPLIRDWPGRLDELISHHAERLELMAEAAGAGASAYQVATRVFPFERYTPHEKRFAVAETISHLELLTIQGRLHKAREEHWIYGKS